MEGVQFFPLFSSLKPGQLRGRDLLAHPVIEVLASKARFGALAAAG